MTRAPAAALLVLALSGTPAVTHGAQAGDGWSIAETDSAVAPPGAVVAVSSAGRLLAAGTECEPSRCFTVLATRAPGASFARTGRVAGMPAAVAELRDGAALLVTAPRSRRGLTAVDVTPAGRVVGARPLASGFARDASTASNRRGTTAAAWLTSGLPQRLRVRIRGRDGRAFGRARTLATFSREGDFGGAALAVSPRGEVAALWASRGELRARVRRPGRRGFGPVLRAGRSDRLARIAAVYTARGMLVTIWSSADAGEQQDRHAIVRVGSLLPGAGRFTPPRKLGEGADREALAIARGAAVRAVAAGHTANIAWTSRSLQVRLGTVHADGAVSAVRVVEARGVLADAAGSTSGLALIAWTHDPLGPEASARAVARISPERLGPTESAGPSGSWASGAALDDTGTRAVVSWGAGDPLTGPRWGVAERPAR